MDSFISWIGGKKLLRKKIIEQFPEGGYDRYLSYNDCPEIRQLYSGYRMVQVDRNDNLAVRAGARRYHELIITNY